MSLKLGLIGCGGIGKHHLLSVKELAFDLLGAADINLAAAQEETEITYDVKEFTIGTVKEGDTDIQFPVGSEVLDETPRGARERERQAILDTLQVTHGKLAETARRLGISRTTLWRRLRAYGLRPNGHRGSGPATRV